MALPDFLLDPCSALLVFYLISRSLDWHVQQITFRQKNFKRFEDFRRRFWQYSRAYVGFDRVNHSNSIFITTENHHVGEIFTLAPVFFFPWPRSAPTFFILESPLQCQWVIRLLGSFTLWRPAEKKLPSVESRCTIYSYFTFPKPTIESRALCFPLQGTNISY